jgi:cytochrome b561
MTEQVLHYNRVARWLHWTIAVLIIANLVIGIFHDGLGKAFPAMPIHKSIGMLVLVLSLVRLGWRLTHPAPPLPASVSRIETGLAHGFHWLLYALMIVMPMSGWIFSSAGKYPLGFFGLFEIPKFALTKADPIVGLAHEGHEVLGYAMAALVVGHIAAALRHHFLLKDGVLRRMLPAR